MSRSRFEIDAHVIDVLMRQLVGRDQRPSAFLVYLWMWRATFGSRRPHCEVSYHDLAHAVGISRSAVQDAVALLIRRKLVRAERASRTAVPKYEVRRPWRRVVA